MSMGSEMMYEAMADAAWDEYKMEKGIWTTRDGREIPICEMTDSHLANTIRMMRRNGVRLSDGVAGEFLETMLEEARRRERWQTMTKTKRQLREEAVERLKNCVAARFDAESIVIALTSGRHGQSDWSLECDKLIYLLTDDANDDSTPEKVVSGSEPCVTPESCRQYADQRKQGDDADCESCDSREQLEADVLEAVKKGFITYETLIEWLDRQAAITDAEWEREVDEHREAVERRANKLQEQVDELEAKREHQRRELAMFNNLVNTHGLAITDDCWDYRSVRELCDENDELQTRLLRVEADCERYRFKFGKCLDYADAIHALMDDEGMA